MNYTEEMGNFWKYFERETDTKNILHIIFQVHH